MCVCKYKGIHIHTHAHIHADELIYEPPHMAGQRLDDQLEHTSNSYVRIRDAALKTCQRR